MRQALRADVVIVGAGIMGSSLAYWLRRMDSKISVLLVERDTTYSQASSALSAASIRQQFTTPVNIRISQASIGFLRQADELLEVEGTRAHIGLSEQGYLYVAQPAGLERMRRAHEIQTAHGAPVALLSPTQLADRFPWLEVSDLAMGSLGLSAEGWFDGYSLLTAVLRKARSLGAGLMRAEVSAFGVSGRSVTSVVLADGTSIQSAYVVNAAGPWARAVAALVGIDLPVVARRRTVYVVACRSPLQPFPLLIDPSGFWIRPEGRGYIAGMTPAHDPDGAPLEPDYPAFESILWPALAARIPAFQEARLERAWAGYYEMNLFDHNGVLGLHPQFDNFLALNGFSGHGMQQGPIVGRGLAERILFGRYVSLDLSDLGCERLTRGRPLVELNVI